jgi:predicted ATPase
LMYGLDSKVYALATLSLVLWLLGDRDEAWARGHEAIKWARELRHAPSEAAALLYFSGLPHYEQDRAKVSEVTETLTDVVDRHGLLMFKAFCGILRGWADTNVDFALKNLEAVRGSGQQIGFSYWLSLIAECEAASGAYGSALSRVDEAIAHAEATGELYYVADLHRLKGTWLLGQDPESKAAEVSLRRAIAIAQEHSERPAVLRASLALGRLLRARGLEGEARDLVASACIQHDEHTAWGDLVVARTFVVQCGQ